MVRHKIVNVLGEHTYLLRPVPIWQLIASEAATRKDDLLVLTWPAKIFLERSKILPLRMGLRIEVDPAAGCSSCSGGANVGSPSL